jgi:hypothetical protein
VRFVRTDDPTDGGGVVTHAQRWAFDPAGGRDGRGGWVTGDDGKKIVRTDGAPVLFPSPAEALLPSRARPGVVLCEGPWDAITARAAGFDAFGALGVSNVSADDLARLAARPHAKSGGLCLAFDADDGGRDGTARVLRLLRDRADVLAGFGGRVLDASAEMPDGDDVNSYAAGHDLDGLAYLFTTAPEADLGVPDAFPDGRSRRRESGPYGRETSFPIPDPLVGGSSGMGRVSGIVPLFGFSKPTPREWTVSGWVPEGYTTILAADGGSGKSFIAMFAAVCVATGRAFLGRSVKRGRVLYADFELDADEQKRRLWAVLHGMGLTPEAESITDRLHYFRPSCSLADGGADEIAAAAREVGASLVILDSLTIALGGDAMDQATATNAMNALRDCGTVLALDHVSSAGARGAAKDARPFGSVFKRNLARATFQLATEEDGVRILRPDKANFGPGSATVSFRMEFDGPEGEEVRFVPLDVADEADAAATLRHLRADERITTALAAIYAANPAAYRAGGVTPHEVQDWLAERMEVGAPSIKTVQTRLSALVKPRGGNALVRKAATGYLPSAASPSTDVPGSVGGVRAGGFSESADGKEGGGFLPPPPTRGSGIGNVPHGTVWADSENTPEEIGNRIGNAPGTTGNGHAPLPAVDGFDALARPFPDGLPPWVRSLGRDAPDDGDGGGTVYFTDADDDLVPLPELAVPLPDVSDVPPPDGPDDDAGLRRVRDALRRPPTGFDLTDADRP